jgi:hypothetical protein
MSWTIQSRLRGGRSTRRMRCHDSAVHAESTLPKTMSRGFRYRLSDRAIKETDTDGVEPLELERPVGRRNLIWHR